MPVNDAQSVTFRTGADTITLVPGIACDLLRALLTKKLIACIYTETVHIPEEKGSATQRCKDRIKETFYIFIFFEKFKCKTIFFVNCQSTAFVDHGL